MVAQAQLTVGGVNQSGAEEGVNLPPAKSKPKVLNSGPRQMLLYIWALRGPVRDNTNAFNAWSAQMVADIYHNGFPTNATYLLSNHVMAAYVTQPPGAGNATNNTVWYAFRAISLSGNDIEMNNFSFWGTSSDNPGYLNTATALSSTNTIYSARLMGIVGAPPVFPRNGDGVLIAGRVSDTDVREGIFIGAQMPYFLSPESAVDSFIDEHPNWRVKGSWNYVVGGVTNAYSVKSLDSNLALTPAFTNSLPAIHLSVSPTNSAMFRIAVNADVGNSVVLLQRKEVTGTGWNVLATGNSQDVWTGSMTNREFFDLRSQ